LALPSTVLRFEIALSDTDRGVYEQLELRVAQHPSESDRYLVTRVLARCLEHEERLEIGPGISDGDEPTLYVRDLTGQLQLWIDVGMPATNRLHRASKAAPRVIVYATRDAHALRKELVAQRVHHQEKIVVKKVDASLVDALVGTLSRHNRWELVTSGGTLYLTVNGNVFEGTIEEIPPEV
jgi:uncharacterized protein YaeQ